MSTWRAVGKAGCQTVDCGNTIMNGDAVSIRGDDPNYCQGAGECTLHIGVYGSKASTFTALVTTSDAFFEENYMPYRAANDRIVGAAPPTRPPDADSGAPMDPAEHGGATSDTTTTTPQGPPTTMPQAFDRATRSESANARQSRTVLLLFSGPQRRPDGLNVFLNQLGYDAEMIDSDPIHGGGDGHNLTRDDVYLSLQRRITGGEFLAIIAAPPCSTFSISRFFTSKSSADGGPQPLRLRDLVMGVAGLSRGRAEEVAKAKEGKVKHAPSPDSKHLRSSASTMLLWQPLQHRQLAIARSLSRHDAGALPAPRRPARATSRCASSPARRPRPAKPFLPTRARRAYQTYGRARPPRASPSLFMERTLSTRASSPVFLETQRRKRATCLLQNLCVSRL